MKVIYLIVEGGAECIMIKVIIKLKVKYEIRYRKVKYLIVAGGTECIMIKVIIKLKVNMK